MYFDDYSTSFQSLYSPMYNLRTNYSQMGPNMGGGFGAGYGMGMMGGYDPLMSGVGVGQMGADQLVRGDQQVNNYYTRPIATHKKKDELPMILGIIGTALGTAAVLMALRKGKKAPKITPPAPPVVPPTNVADDVVQNFTNNTIKGGNTLPAVIGTAKPGVGGAGNGISGSNTGVGTGTGTTPIGGTPAIINRTVNRPNGSWKDGAVDTPFEEIGQQVFGSNTQRLLGAKSQNLLEAPAQYLGLPAPGNGGLPAVINNRNNFIKGYLPAPAQSVTGMVAPELAAVNNNFVTIRPDLAGKGNIVHTTHTPESLANGYSIGSNAKGADKLAELLAKLQA